MSRRTLVGLLAAAILAGACAGQTSGSERPASADRSDVDGAIGVARAQDEASAICGALARAPEGSGIAVFEALVGSAQDRGIDFDALRDAMLATCPAVIAALMAEADSATGSPPPAASPQPPPATAPGSSSGSAREFPVVPLGTEIVCQNFGTVWDPCTVLEIRVIETCDSYVRFGEPIVIAFRVRGTLAQVGSLDDISGTRIPFNMYPRVHGGDGVVYETGISSSDTCVPEPRAPRLPSIIRTGITQEAWYGIPVAREAVDGFRLMLGYTFWER